MNIPLKELLATNNRVIVPNLGAFIVKQGSDFKVIFNEYLKFNDGLLINHIAEKEGISKEEAEKKTKDFVDEISQTIEAGNPYIFEDLGQISKDSKGRKIFEQLEDNAPSTGESVDIATQNLEMQPIEPIAEKEEVVVNVPEMTSQPVESTDSEVVEEIVINEEKVDETTEIVEVIEEPGQEVVESLSSDPEEGDKSSSDAFPPIIPDNIQETSSPVDAKSNKDATKDVLPDLDETEVQKEVARKVEKAQSKDASKIQKAEKERLKLAEKERKAEEKKAIIAAKEKEKKRILAEKEQAKLDKQAKKLMGEELKKEGKKDKKPKDKKPAPPPDQKKKSKAGLIILIIAAVIIIGGGGFVALKWDLVMGLLNSGSGLAKIEKTLENKDHFGTKKHSETKKEDAVVTDTTGTKKASDTVAKKTHATDAKAEKEDENKKEHAKTTDKNVKETPKNTDTKKTDTKKEDTKKAEESQPVKETKAEVKSEKATTTPTVSNNTQGNYHIVVGAFQTEANANKYISKLSTRGLNARILRKRGGLYIVVSSSHATNQEASVALKKYKNEVDPNAWMLKD